MINNLRKENGITLIALVVTIIVIVILASITLSLVLGPEGIFKKASDAGKIQKIKNTSEMLEMKALDAKATVLLSGEDLIEEFINILKNDGTITDNDIDDEYGLFIIVDDLEFKIEEENSNIKVICKGEKDEVLPSLETCIIRNTTNSIIVEAKGRKIESINYYIKTSEDGEYELIASNTTGNYVFEGLEQDKNYYIKIEVVNKNGTDSKEYTKTTGIVTAGTQEGAIVFSNVIWNPENHTASVDISTNTDYSIQYMKSGGNWITANKAIDLYSGDTLYGRLWDGVNGGSSASLKIEDKTEPTITLTKGTVTTNSVQLIATITDNQSGIANGTIFNFYIKKKNQDDSLYELKQSNSNSSCTFTGLEQNVDYIIKVIAKDYAENDGKSIIEVKTGVVTTTSNGNIIFTPSTTSWTNGDVKVIASSSVSDFIVKISKNADFSEAVLGSTGVTMTANGTVYARLEDSTGQSNGVASTIIENIDKLPPNAFTPTATSNTNSVTINASTTDATAASGSGQSNGIQYRYKFGDGSWTDWTTATSKTWEYSDGIRQSTTYTLYVQAKDAAGNTKDASVSKATTGVTASSGNITFTPSTTSWTNGNVVVKASTTTGYSVVISTNSNLSGAVAGSTGVTMTANGTVYAQLRDASGQSNGTASTNIINIDKLPPNAFTPTATSNTNSVTVSASTTDANAASGSGKSDGIQYRFSKDNGANYTAYQTSGSCTFNSLTQNTTYNIKVQAKDAAGNVREGAVNKATAQVPASSGNITFSLSTTSWTNGNVVVYASSNIAGYTAYLHNGSSYSTLGSTGVTFTGNGTAYAILLDSTGQSNGYATCGVTNIDKSAPTYTGAEIKNVSTTGYDVYVYGVSDNGGSGVNRVQFPTWTEYNGQDDIQGSWWDWNSSARGTVLSDGTTWVYRVNITAHNNETGQYHTHVYLYDNLGNGVCCWTHDSVVVPSVPVASGNIGCSGATWSSYRASVTLSTASGYAIQYQVGSYTGGWTTGTTVTNLVHGSVVYARLWDGVNGGSYTSFTIVDSAAPSVSVWSGGASTNAITAYASASDGQYGMPGSPTYNFYIYGGQYSSYTLYQSSTSSGCTFTGLWQGTSYLIYVTSADAAGNWGEGATWIGTGTVPASDGNITFSLSTTSWTNGNVVVYASSNIAGYTAYLHNGSSYSTLGSTGVTFTGNGTAYAILVDSTGQSNGYATCGVTNIDKSAPNAFTPTATSTSNSITVSASTSDSQSGGVTYAFSCDNGASFTGYQASGSYTFTGLADNTTYYIRVRAKDAAGNTTDGTVSIATESAYGIRGYNFVTTSYGFKVSYKYKVPEATDYAHRIISTRIYVWSWRNGSFMSVQTRGSSADNQPAEGEGTFEISDVDSLNSYSPKYKLVLVVEYKNTGSISYETQRSIVKFEQYATVDTYQMYFMRDKN